MLRHGRESGSAAVEFALVVPVLLLLVLGIIEFGRIYSIQTTLSAAAREGVRTMALESSPANAKTAAKNVAAPLITLTDAQIVVAPSTCVVSGTAATATVTITYPVALITEFFGTSITLTGKGAMRCNG